MDLIPITGCGKVAIFYVHSAEYEGGEKISTILLLIINALSALIAIFGNALFLFTLKNSRVLRGPTYILTGTLSLLDFLVGLIIQPLFMLAIGWPFFKTENVCRYYWAMSVIVPVMASGSMTLLTMIAIDRFVAVVFNLSYRHIVTKRHAITGICFATAVNIGCGILAYVNKKGPIHFWTISAWNGINYSVTLLCYGAILLVLKLKRGIFIA